MTTEEWMQRAFTEKRKLMETAKEAKDNEELVEILEDIFWAILNSKEFLFQH